MKMSAELLRARSHTVDAEPRAVRNVAATVIVDFSAKDAFLQADGKPGGCGPRMPRYIMDRLLQNQVQLAPLVG